MKVPERTSEALKRLHSLTGMIPLGAFLIEHLMVNALGVTIVACHFGNGLRGFAVRWGLARTPGAERAAGRLGLALSAALALVAVASLFAFRRAAAVPGLAP